MALCVVCFAVIEDPLSLEEKWPERGISSLRNLASEYLSRAVDV